MLNNSNFRMSTTSGALLLALAPVGHAAAAELYTPPLYSDPGNVLYCTILNVGKTDATVNIKLMNTDGTQVSGYDFNVPLVPGAATMISYTYNAVVYCKFSVEHSRQDFRGSISVYRWGEGVISALPAE